MLQLSKVAPDCESHEEVFLSRYKRLGSWALQFTSNDREQAEDLVHDAYIQFNLARPDLNAINNLDGYLYRMLRNLHLSQVRRSLRQEHRTLSIIDYDSAEVGLRAADPRQQIRLQDELRQVCQYACARKETSKAGSVLILRFLHGYYPKEIAEVMRGTRQAVEERLRLARSEARQYLENPNRLHFMRGAAAARIPADQMGFARPTDELLRELRQTVFASRNGTCLAQADVRNLYAGEEVSGIEQAMLGHIASCARCLDEVNRVLDLPLLAERFPTDTIGNDRDSKGDGPKGDGGDDCDQPPLGGLSEKELRRFRKRAKDVFENRPLSLAVSINGYSMAVQNVGSEFSKQTLSINTVEKIDFIEVFGEQDTRLLFLMVEDLPPAGDYQRSMRVELSDDRTLEATLSFSNPWPTLQVVYTDPLAHAEEAAAEAQGEGVGIPALLAPAEAAQLAVAQPVFDPKKLSKGNISPNIIVRAWRWFRVSGFGLRPGTITVALSLILVVALLIVRLRVPTVSAAEILQRSAVAEETIAANPAVVVHRTIFLEERRFNKGSSPGSVVSRLRIEAWQSAGHRIKLRRIYDEQNHLLAGEWSKSDGTSMVYQRGTKPQTRTAPDVGAKAILETGELWRLDASARNFQVLIGRGTPITVEEKSDAYVISYQSDDAGLNSRLLQATLMLNKADGHAVEQTLTLQHDGDMREFRFIEADFEQNSTDSIAPELLRPDPELLAPSEGGEDKASADLLHNDTTAFRSSEIAASPELEIEVTYLLNRIKANLGEQVTMTRITGGALRVEALVETEGRKEEILRALGPLHSNPAVKLDVRTVAEAVKHGERDLKSGEVTVREVEVPNSRIPADLELRAYFSARLVGSEAINLEINRYASLVMGHSRQALLHASALKRLVGRFSPEEMRTLSPEARAKWLAMIREHVLGYRREISILKRELASVFSARESAGEAGNEVSAIQNAERLVKFSYANDDTVRSAFTISADGRTTAGIKSEQFWSSLATAERLAAAIQNRYQN